MTEETIRFFGYSDRLTTDVRLDEYTRLEMEDIMRSACVRLGGTFDLEQFNEYWRKAQERKRLWLAS